MTVLAFLGVRSLDLANAAACQTAVDGGASSFDNFGLTLVVLAHLASSTQRHLSTETKALLCSPFCTHFVARVTLLLADITSNALFDLRTNITTI